MMGIAPYAVFKQGLPNTTKKEPRKAAENTA